MADSLFDNRYRYDYIYPRGRSGETLRAVDTDQNDRPVVIKRPAPNDAPPIRAGQEVSILNERKALMRLSGHPVLTDLLDGGQYFVGGTPHQYIVMERAQGAIVAETVLELARQGERLPTLEMLVIVDALLDLLQRAHANDVVYNDVDSKHLFWNRDSYQLKVIDWGNAVFLEGDEVTPQGVSRQTDVGQVGELLYFVLSGGGRPEVPRDADENWLVDFGDEGENVSPTLRRITSKALHPNLKLRHASIEALRRELNQYRTPLERERDAVINRLNEQLRRDLSKIDLRNLLNILEPALATDPGNPAAKRVQSQINERLRDLEVSADLDAVHIYMSGSNWARALDLVQELRTRAGPGTQQLVELLADVTLLLLDNAPDETSPAIQQAIDLLFEENYVPAANTLLTQDSPDDNIRKLQWLMAERISSKVPEVLLLRPNLYRLELALSTLSVDGVNMNDARSILSDVQDMLIDLPGEATTDITQLRDSYRAVVDRLSMLNKLLSTVVVQRQLSNRKLPLSSLDRALNAAMALADNIHVVGKQGASSPRDALLALDACRSIDPTNRLWQSIFEMLNRLYEMLQSYQTYVPAADGSDLAGWLSDAQGQLSPYLDRLFDDLLKTMVSGLDTAANSWTGYASAVVTGDRARAIEELTQASEAVSTVGPALSGWLNQLRSVVEGARYVERHAIYGGLGRALADGWEAFDRGRLADAERLGQQALEIARDESARQAAQRLVTLADITREWVERNGALDMTRTEAALNMVEDLYTEDEATRRDRFAQQMPSRETYLKAMQKGLVETFANTSTAVLRIFFMNAILLGTLEGHDGNLPDADFWRLVAIRALNEHGPRHIAATTLQEFIDRRRDLTEAAEKLNQLNGTHAFAQLEVTRRQIEEGTQARPLSGAAQALRELELAQRDWADGEFRAAGLKIENALKGIKDTEKAAEISLNAFNSWVSELQAVAADLHTGARQLRQTVERRPATPPQSLLDTHRRQAEMTMQMLGANSAAQLRQWYETYNSFLRVYTDATLRRSAKLEGFNELFKAMFVDRHPAYPLYRHWYDLVDNASEFPAPPTDDPTPRIDDTAAVDESEFAPIAAEAPTETGSPTVAMPNTDTSAEREDLASAGRPVATISQGGNNRRGGFPLRLVLIGGALALVVFVGALLALSGGSEDGEDDPLAGMAVTISDTPDASETALAATELALVITASTATARSATARAALAADATDRAAETTETVEAVTEITEQPTAILITPIEPTARATETETPTPTETDTLTPTDTPTPTATDTPTNTFTPSPSPTPTLPPNGLQGTQELLTLFERMETFPWEETVFSPAAGNPGWEFGMGGSTPEGELFITLPPETLNLYYGNDAPSRLRSTSATLSLVTYNPATLQPADVVFGLLLRSVADPAVQVGVHVQLVNLNAINLWLRNGDDLTLARQLSVNSVNPRLRLERDALTGDVLVFLDDQQYGDPIPFVGLDQAVQPVLFVNDGGVVVNVSAWRVVLR